MSIIGKIMGIAKKNNAQLYEDNGLTPSCKLVCHAKKVDPIFTEFPSVQIAISKYLDPR